MRVSVVIPVYNEATQIAATIRSVTEALLETETFRDAEIIVADDGSSDDSGPTAERAATAVPVRVARLAVNEGKFAARRAGLEAATGSYVLLLDNGVLVVPGSLAYLESELERDPEAEVWNAHTVMDTGSSAVARFWEVVQDIAFAAYQDDPRRTSFGADDFDRFPKGTTLFFAPRGLVVEAYDAFTSLYDDLRHSSDDTALIRWIAERRRINIGPDFACVYRPRTSVSSFFQHSIVRGVHFPDSFRSPTSRFFWPMIAFYPVTAALCVAALRRPLVVPAAAAAVSTVSAATVVARRRPLGDVLAVAALAPVYALGHGIGMWQGAVTIARQRLRR